MELPHSISKAIHPNMLVVLNPSARSARLWLHDKVIGMCNVNTYHDGQFDMVYEYFKSEISKPINKNDGNK